MLQVGRRHRLLRHAREIVCVVRRLDGRALRHVRDAGRILEP